MRVIIAVETGENRPLQPGETGLASKGGIMTWSGDCPSYSCFPVVKLHEFEVQPGTVLWQGMTLEDMTHLLTLPKPKKKVVKEGWVHWQDIGDTCAKPENYIKVTYEVEE